MKMKHFDQLICRTPAFGTNQTLEEVLQQLIPKIEESSPEFHKLIKGLKPEELNGLDEKTRFTLWKYLNRAKYRATPFGTFAAISTLPIAYNPPVAPTLNQQLFQHHLIDWSQKDHTIHHPASEAMSFLTNSSLYFTRNQIRYLKREGSRFELTAVTAQPILNVLLLTCKRKTGPAALTQLLEKTFDIDAKHAANLLQQLVDLQLLVTNRHPNITGEDYFTRLELPVTIQPSNYILSERNLEKGSFDGKLLKHVPALLQFFAQHLRPTQNPDLIEFKHAFNKRFENQEIPLSLAMDPELGIGYGGLAKPQEDDPLISEIRNLQSSTEQQTIPYGKLHQFLLKGIIENRPINLDEFTSNTLEKNQLPNTTSLIFHRYKNSAVLAPSGGCTANSLLGRFTHCGTSLEALGRTIANLETKANPDVLFFEVAYQAEKKIDNVNRRQLLYPLELPILTWSQTAQPLDMDDILVAVEGGQVILKSKSLGKRLIPRIASAYNHNRSDLSVYRFLCAIQGQGLLTNLSLQLKQHFPDLDRYPRLCFKDIIVSPAQWKIPTWVLKSTQVLSDWLTKSAIDFPFKVGSSDQSLTIDPKAKEDLQALLCYGKQQSEAFYLTEALLEPSDFLQDQHGNGYAGEYIASFYHQQPIYTSSPPRKPSIAQVYLPGSKWLYVEIYGHPSSANALLLGPISTFITQHTTIIKNWFFIRYTDPSAHIRLRLQLKDPSKGFALLSSLEAALSAQVRDGQVSDVKLASYRPETLRYGTTRMALVENFFHFDTKYVLQQIKRARTTEQLIASSLDVVMDLCACCFSDQAMQLAFIQRHAQRFAHEMQLDPATFKKINISFSNIPLSQPITSVHSKGSTNGKKHLQRR